MAMSSRVIEQAIAARSAATVLRRLRRIDKDDLLAAMGIGLRKGVDEILAANGADVDRGRDAGMDEALLDRLTLTPERIEGCLLYTSPSPRDRTRSRMPSSA